MYIGGPLIIEIILRARNNCSSGRIWPTGLVFETCSGTYPSEWQGSLSIALEHNLQNLSTHLILCRIYSIYRDIIVITVTPNSAKSQSVALNNIVLCRRCEALHWCLSLTCSSLFLFALWNMHIFIQLWLIPKRCSRWTGSHWVFDLNWVVVFTLQLERQPLKPQAVNITHRPRFRHKYSRHFVTCRVGISLYILSVMSLNTGSWVLVCLLLNYNLAYPNVIKTWCM